MFDETNFKAAFDQVHASDALLTEVLEMTTHTNQTKRKNHTVRRTLLLAAAVICLLTGTVAAASSGIIKLTGGSAGVIDMLFGNTGDYAEGAAIVRYDENGKLEMNVPAWNREAVDAEVAERLVEPYLYTLEENTVTKGGFTYTLHAVLYDSNTEAYMMYWSVENPEGLGQYGLGVNGEFSIVEGSDLFAVCGGRSYVDTVHSTETKLYVSSYGVDWQEELYCEFGCWQDWDKGKEQAWSDSQRLVIPRSDQGGMQAVTADGVTVSPVAIRLENTHVDAVDELILTYADGSQYVVCSEEQFVDNRSYALGDTDYVVYTFNRIVDVEQVSGIVINGEVFPVN